MSLDPMILVVIGALMATVALARRPWKARVHNVEGNTVVGNVTGAVNQNYQVGQHVTRDPAPGIGTAQIITWVIAIAGVIVAGIGAYLNSVRP